MKRFILFFFFSLSLIFSQELPKELKVEIEKLKSDSPVERTFAVYRIGNLKCDIKDCLPYLIDIIDDEREVISKYLGKTSPAKESKKVILKLGKLSLPYIYEKLKEPDIPKSKKIKIIEIIGEIKDENGIKYLEKFLNESDFEVKEAALKILLKYENEAEFLINFSKNQDEYLRLKIISGFGENGIKNSLPYLYECLNDKNWEIRKYAVWAIGEIKENVNIEKLIPLIKDKNEFVRKEVAETFGKLKNPFTVSGLIELLSDSNWMVRSSSIKALGEIGDKRAFEPVLNLLYDKQVEVKIEVIRTLALFKDKRATIPLISNLNDRYHLLVREYSAYALGEIKDKRAIYPLIGLLKSDNYELRKIARDSLRKITGVDFGYDRKKWYDWAERNKISSIKEG